MSLKQQLCDQLEAFTNGATLADGPQTIEASDEGRRIFCEVTAVGPLGCAVNHVTLETEELADTAIEDLKAIGQSLAAKLTYLLEPVATIEVDDGATGSSR